MEICSYKLRRTAKHLLLLMLLTSFSLSSIVNHSSIKKEESNGLISPNRLKKEESGNKKITTSKKSMKEETSSTERELALRRNKKNTKIRHQKKTDIKMNKDEKDKKNRKLWWWKKKKKKKKRRRRRTRRRRRPYRPRRPHRKTIYRRIPPKKYRRPASYYQRKGAANARSNGCILSAEFRHFFYNLLTRSSEFTVQFTSNCAKIPEITFQVFYQNHMYISWYNHPTEVFMNIFNNVYKLKFKKPKDINVFDITKAKMYQNLTIGGIKMSPGLINLNFNNQIMLTKQHMFGFEKANISRLATHVKPIPCFVRRDMKKGWRKILKRLMLAKKNKAKQLKMMMDMMMKKPAGRRLSLVKKMPDIKKLVNRELFDTFDNVQNRTSHIKQVKNKIKMVKKKGNSVGRSLKMINSTSPAERNLKAKKRPRPAKAKRKKKKLKGKKGKKKKAKKSKKQKKKDKHAKFMKMVKKVARMKYKMNKEFLLKKMKKKLIKGYYLICASP